MPSKIFIVVLSMLLVLPACRKSPTPITSSTTQSKTNELAVDDSRIGGGSSNILVKATWEPFSDSKYEFGKRWSTLGRLSPGEPTRHYSQAELSVFSPPSGSKFGEPWDIDVLDWLPFEEAVAKSCESGKPLHVVALFGVLDDESC